MLNYTLACIFTQQLIYTIIPHAVLVHITKKEQTQNELRHRYRMCGTPVSFACHPRCGNLHALLSILCVHPPDPCPACVFSPPCTGREIPGWTGSKEWSVKHAAGRVQFPGRFPSERLVQGFPTRESVLQTVLPGHQGGIGGNELLRMHSMTFLLIAPDSFVFLPVLPPGGGKPITRGNYLPRSSLSMISLASGACFSIFSGNPK